jgi:CspA family cold shock protein
MKTGKVLWFDAVKGYGFIAQDDGSEDIFVHFRYINLVNDERVELQKNQSVSYEVEDGKKGQHAVNVSVIPS